MVTGAGSGIGRATALRFAREGFTVVANGRRLDKLQETVQAALGLAGHVLPVTGDVGSKDTAVEITRRARESGDYRWLVNNAGIGWSYGVADPGAMSGLRETSAEQWREVLRINLDSVYFLCHEALQQFCARGAGSIVNVSSGGGLRGMEDAHTYATSKAAVINLTRSLARA